MREAEFHVEERYGEWEVYQDVWGEPADEPVATFSREDLAVEYVTWKNSSNVEKK